MCSSTAERWWSLLLRYDAGVTEDRLYGTGTDGYIRVWSTRRAFIRDEPTAQHEYNMEPFRSLAGVVPSDSGRWLGQLELEWDLVVTAKERSL